MTVFDEPKIDCHAHVTDPDRFPYGADISYHPAGQEIGTADQMVQMMETYGIRHSLLVQPNSGYGPDNSCLIDAIARHPRRFLGAAIVAMDASSHQLTQLKLQGIAGIAFNPTMYGTDYYAGSAGLIRRMAELDMFLNIQVAEEQILMFEPWIREIPVRVLVDHCGRPTPEDGLDQPGFASLLGLADTGRVWVKLSGYPKFSRMRFPFADAAPYVRALIDTFTADRCLWSSDWPYLRAPDRQDVGPLIRLAESLFPDPAERRKFFWETPEALFGFEHREHDKENP